MVKPKEELDEAALLDYYSDMGISHITIFIACLFGIFTVLGLIDNNFSSWKTRYLSLAYLILSLGGAHSLLRWSYYVRISDYIATDLGASVNIMPRDNDPRYSYWNWTYFDPKLSRVLQGIYKMMKGFKGTWFVIFVSLLYGLLCCISWYAVVWL